MFTSEVIVGGKYVKGKITSWNEVYNLYCDNLIENKDQGFWEVNELRKITKELNEIINKMDSLNASKILTR